MFEGLFADYNRAVKSIFTAYHRFNLVVAALTPTAGLPLLLASNYLLSTYTRFEVNQSLFSLPDLLLSLGAMVLAGFLLGGSSVLWWRYIHSELHEKFLETGFRTRVDFVAWVITVAGWFLWYQCVAYSFDLSFPT